MIHRERDLIIVRAPGSAVVLLADEDMSVEENEAIVVGAIGTGTPGS